MAREHRKEKRRKKGQEAEEQDAVQIEGDVVDESMQDKGNLISYCSLDYQRFFDMARYPALQNQPPPQRGAGRQVIFCPV